MDFQEIVTGFCFLEAPRTVGDDLWFTDLLLGGVYRRSSDGTTDRFMPENKHVGGLALNRDGRMICGGPGGLKWLDPDNGQWGWLLQSIDGEPLSGTNDFLPDGHGGIWFGTLSRAEYGQKPTTTELCHVDAAGKAVVVAEGLSFANGVGLSPDGKRLYHVESLRGIFAHEMRADGSLGPRTLFSDRQDGDGCAVDMEGGLWVAGCMSGEIARYRPDGTLERTVKLPHAQVTSVAFGGRDWRDMYVVTAGNNGIGEMMAGRLPERAASIFRARADVPGVPVAMTDFALPGR
jgi:sugar lactone lactonase YvrE